MKTKTYLATIVGLLVMVLTGCKVPSEPQPDQASRKVFDQKKAEMRVMKQKADVVRLEMQKRLLPAPPAPTEETVDLQIEGPTFTPPHTRGDRDFHGHGPDVHSSARLSIKNQNQLWLDVYMKAEETKKDYTTAEGSHSFCVLNDPYTYATITGILSDNYSEHSYKDTDHAVDRFTMPADELVNQFEYVGDTKGDEAGTRTHVKLYLNPIKMKVVKNKGPGPTIEVSPTSKYVPDHVGGDEDFHGHGPDVVVSAKISIKNQKEIWATIYMWAKEWKKDYTEVEGTTNYKIYSHEKPIKNILSDTYSYADYTDTDHADDELFLGGAELVNRFIVTGDTKGNEAGTRTGVRVYWNPITLED
jgi:hypothetical protein